MFSKPADIKLKLWSTSFTMFTGAPGGEPPMENLTAYLINRTVKRQANEGTIDILTSQIFV